MLESGSLYIHSDGRWWVQSCTLKISQTIPPDSKSIDKANTTWIRTTCIPHKLWSRALVSLTWFSLKRGWRRKLVGNTHNGSRSHACVTCIPHGDAPMALVWDAHKHTCWFQKTCFYTQGVKRFRKSSYRWWIPQHSAVTAAKKLGSLFYMSWRSSLSTKEGWKRPTCQVLADQK